MVQLRRLHPERRWLLWLEPEDRNELLEWCEELPLVEPEFSRWQRNMVEWLKERPDGGVLPLTSGEVGTALAILSSFSPVPDTLRDAIVGVYANIEEKQERHNKPENKAA